MESVREVTPAELLSQLREMVEIIAMPDGEQLAWLVANRLPAGELALQLDHAVPSWFGRLRGAGVLHARAEAALASLHESVMKLLTYEHERLWTDEGLSDPGWQHIRNLASEALDAIDQQH